MEVKRKPKGREYCDEKRDCHDEPNDPSERLRDTWRSRKLADNPDDEENEERQ